MTSTSIGRESTGRYGLSLRRSGHEMREAVHHVSNMNGNRNNAGGIGSYDNRGPEKSDAVHMDCQGTSCDRPTDNRTYKRRKAMDQIIVEMVDDAGGINSDEKRGFDKRGAGQMDCEGISCDRRTNSTASKKRKSMEQIIVETVDECSCAYDEDGYDDTQRVCVSPMPPLVQKSRLRNPFVLDSVEVEGESGTSDDDEEEFEEEEDFDSEEVTTDDCTDDGERGDEIDGTDSDDESEFVGASAECKNCYRRAPQGSTDAGSVQMEVLTVRCSTIEAGMFRKKFSSLCRELVESNENIELCRECCTYLQCLPEGQHAVE